MWYIQGNKDDPTIAVARVVHQHTDLDLEVKLGEDLSEDNPCILKNIIQRYPDVFTDMPGETDVIQHRVKLKHKTPIGCKPYLLP